jgi:hypothetical protein
MTAVDYSFITQELKLWRKYTEATEASSGDDAALGSSALWCLMLDCPRTLPPSKPASQPKALVAGEGYHVVLEEEEMRRSRGLGVTTSIAEQCGCE